MSCDGTGNAVQELLLCGADPNARCVPNQLSQTPLHLAVTSGSLNAAGYLLAHGADMNAVDDLGRTPILTALLYSRDHMFLYLATAGAKLDVVGVNDFINLVHYTAWAGSTATMQLIAEYVKQGKLACNGVNALHHGHDILYCFEYCRNMHFAGHRDEEEWPVFQRMLQEIRLRHRFTNRLSTRFNAFSRAAIVSVSHF
jgi:ankyrin repeat protein